MVKSSPSETVKSLVSRKTGLASGHRYFQLLGRYSEKKTDDDD